MRTAAGNPFYRRYGVLGNLLTYAGDDALLKSREIKDLDIAVRTHGSQHLIRSSFDQLEVDQKSLSIPNKLIFRGGSFDGNCNWLSQASADVYLPEGQSGVFINGVEIIDCHWENPVQVNLFGVPVNFHNPHNLLEMKLGILPDNGAPRKKDLGDIFNLIGVCQKRGCDPLWLREFMPNSKRKRLNEVLGMHNDFAESNQLLLDSSDSYREELYYEGFNS